MKRVKEFAKKFGYKKTYDHARDLVKDPDVDVVDLCTPPFAHSEIAIQAFEAGKHVICEKPLARTGKEAQAMLQAAREGWR